MKKLNNRSDSPSNCIPNHVAIIMDGNGRWAEERSHPRIYGHRSGYKNLHRVVELFNKRTVKHLTLFGFSTENWERPRPEVDAIMNLAVYAEEDVQKLHEKNVRVLQVGRRDRLSTDLIATIETAENLTKNNTGMTLNIAFDYGGRYDVVHAVRSVVQAGLPVNEITEDTFAKHMLAGWLPDVDLLIRTANEYRISNFLLWHAAYAELYFSEVLWPDFGDAEVETALNAYAIRRRRFGKIS